MESRVNAYGTSLPHTFVAARGEYLIAADGKSYFDMFSSAGVANFGHNHPVIRDGIVEYLRRDGVVHGLDYFTETKLRFVDEFERVAMPAAARGRYRYYFAPPSGTLCMEAAIKYARAATGRRGLGCFTNAFHGLTYNALSMTGNVAKRRAAYHDLAAVTRLPYQGYLGAGVDDLAMYATVLRDPSAGAGSLAALVFETIQAEGGVNACDGAWYEGLLALCREEGIVSIVDDIQAGCGRAGGFFSFEALSTEMPDVVCLAKGLSGYGLPMALVLLRKELDVLDPGENSGTFRGNNLGVHAGWLMLRLYGMAETRSIVEDNERLVASAVREIAASLPVRGRGLLYGIVLPSEGIARRIQSELADDGVLVERCGGSPGVIKIMPPLLSRREHLARALETVLVHLRGAVGARPDRVEAVPA